MFRTMLKSKIHRATVTQADLNYVGSVTVDEDLMDAADLLAGEKVAIVDVTNGARLETYVIAGLVVDRASSASTAQRARVVPRRVADRGRGPSRHVPPLRRHPAARRPRRGPARRVLGVPDARAEV